MTDELSIHASRSRRGADTAGAASARGSPPPGGHAGEAAWRLGAPSPEPSSRRRAPGEEPVAAFPPFPGLGGADEEQPAGPGLDVQRFVRGVWKRRWLVAGVAVALTLVAGLLAFTLLKHRWEAFAVLMLRTHQDRFALGSSAPFKPQEHNLKTLLDTVKLPSSLDAVMAATGVSVLPRTLAAAIEVSPGKDSNVFQVRVTWDNPRLAASIANEVASILVERSRSMRRSDAEEAYRYYAAQLEEARDKRRAVNAGLRQFQEASQASDFDAEIKVLIEELSRLDAEHGTKTAEAQAIGAARERLERAIAEQPEMVVISTIYRSPLKQRLAEYEWQLEEARSRYTEQNPKVIKLQQEIAVLERMIKESNDEGAPQNTYAPNTQRSNMEMRLQDITDELKVREAQVQALGQTIQGMRAKLSQLSAGKKEYELIRSRLDGAETLEANLIGRVEEARLMMLRNEASFDLVEPARPPQEPAPSGRKLAVAGGVVLGTVAGLVLALLLELLDPLVRTRRDAADLTGVDLVWEFERVPPNEHTLVDTQAPAEPVATLFRRLVNLLDARMDEDEWRSVGITSVEPRAGRSLVATNLAQALALKERAVTLVDADLRPTAGTRASETFEIPAGQPGLWQALHEGTEIDDLPIPTETRGLRLLCHGAPPAAAGAGEDGLVALGSRQLHAVVAGLKQAGQHVVFDLPPLTAQETVAEAAVAIGNLILVARSGQTRRADLRDAAELLQERGAHLRAVLLTDVPGDVLSVKPAFDAARGGGRRHAASRRGGESGRPGSATHA